MYRRILALLDSPYTWDRVISQAESLARGHDAIVTLLLVTESPGGRSDRSPHSIEAHLEEEAAALRRHGLTVLTALRRGSPAIEVVSYSRDHPADVIVMAAPPAPS